MVNYLSGQDAINLYRRLHARRVAVMVLNNGSVLNDPGRRPDEDGVISIPRFRYKAYFADISRGHVPEHLEAFLSWAGSIGCPHERDARVLPLHFFDSETDWLDLNEAPGRERFEQARGRPSDRHDCRGLPWRVDPARHAGRDPQQVAGLELSRGLHWDVQSGRQRARLPTPQGAFLMKPGSHLNVAPNGNVRAGKGVRQAHTRLQLDG